MRHFTLYFSQVSGKKSFHIKNACIDTQHSITQCEGYAVKMTKLKPYQRYWLPGHTGQESICAPRQVGPARSSPLGVAFAYFVARIYVLATKATGLTFEVKAEGFFHKYFYFDNLENNIKGLSAICIKFNEQTKTHNITTKQDIWAEISENQSCLVVTKAKFK